MDSSLNFRVDDMTCGGCVASITKAVRAVDPQAVVRADPASHRVEVASSRVDAASIEAAIRNAGFTPVAQPA